jgi:hypothetical protein
VGFRRGTVSPSPDESVDTTHSPLSNESDQRGEFPLTDMAWHIVNLPGSNDDLVLILGIDPNLAVLNLRARRADRLFAKILGPEVLIGEHQPVGSEQGRVCECG